MLRPYSPNFTKQKVLCEKKSQRTIITPWYHLSWFSLSPGQYLSLDSYAVTGVPVLPYCTNSDKPLGNVFNNIVVFVSHQPTILCKSLDVIYLFSSTHLNYVSILPLSCAKVKKYLKFFLYFSKKHSTI